LEGALTVEHIQQREGRWVIIDLAGKVGRIHAVTVPAGVKTRIDQWLAAAAITRGYVLHFGRTARPHRRVPPGQAILDLGAEVRRREAT
jgi:hypothetical protein